MLEINVINIFGILSTVGKDLIYCSRYFELSLPYSRNFLCVIMLYL